MMYGFGDDASPRSDTVDLVEDLTIEYLYDLLHEAHKVALQHGGKVRTEDLMFVLRKDTKKYTRVEELLFMNEELRKARRAFETDDHPGG